MLEIKSHDISVGGATVAVPSAIIKRTSKEHQSLIIEIIGNQVK
jgi:hypothetical protein